MILLPQPKSFWAPSQHSGQGKTRWRLTARLHDGHIKWRGWFDDRDDADAFLFALVTGSLHIERELWRLPVPEWHPGIGEHVWYAVDTVTFLTTTGSNQTYNKPADFPDGANNSIEGLGAGGGGSTQVTSAGSGGNGGGSYSKIVNFTFTGSSATYRIGSKGPSGTTPTTGGVTYFNASSDPGGGSDDTKLGAKGGTATSTSTGGAGGATATSWGTTKYAGGAGGNGAGAPGGAGGGGGAAGLHGAGGAGSNASGEPGGNGGKADSTTGPTGGAGGGESANGTAGTAGTQWDGSHGSGSGGGGGGSEDSGLAGAGGAGANYGGGSGGEGYSTISNTGAGSGGDGLIVVTYTPAVASSGRRLTLLGAGR